MKPAVARRLRAALGSDAIGFDEAGTARIRGTSHESVRLAVEILAQERVAFAPVGCARSGRHPVEVEAPHTVLDVWPDELVIRVGAGTSLCRLDEVLRAHGLCLGVADGADPETTLGALFAAGDRALRGAVGQGLRERALALTLVDGTGTVRRSGARVVKSVAGFDLTRIHWGARGSLGLILDFTLRVSAQPLATGVVALPCPRERLLEVLEHARTVAQDTASELWIDADIAAAAGLEERAHLVLLREAPQAGVDAWARSLGSELRPTSLLRTLGQLAWSQHRPSFRVTGITLRRLTQERSWEMGRSGMVVDLLAAEAWFTRAEAPSIGAGTACWAENALALAGSTPEVDRVRMETERRLRSVFDPHGLLPAAPAPLARRAQEEAR